VSKDRLGEPVWWRWHSIAPQLAFCGGRSRVRRWQHWQSMLMFRMLPQELGAFIHYTLYQTTTTIHRKSRGRKSKEEEEEEVEEEDEGLEGS